LTGSSCTRGDLLCFSTAEWAVFGAWFGRLYGLAGGALIVFLFPPLAVSGSKRALRRHS
jgi:hypothetical protein